MPRAESQEKYSAPFYDYVIFNNFYDFLSIEVVPKNFRAGAFFKVLRTRIFLNFKILPIYQNFINQSFFSHFFIFYPDSWI